MAQPVGNEAISVVIEKLTEIVGHQTIYPEDTSESSANLKPEHLETPSGKVKQEPPSENEILETPGDRQSDDVPPGGKYNGRLVNSEKQSSVEDKAPYEGLSPESGLESAADLSSDVEIHKNTTQKTDNKGESCSSPKIVFTTQPEALAATKGGSDNRQQIIVNLPSNLGQLNITNTKSLLDSLITLNTNLQKDEPEAASEPSTCQGVQSRAEDDGASASGSSETVKDDREVEPENRDQLYKCAKCDYCSWNKNYLKQHVDLVHNAERPFKCPFCDYAGKRSHSLKEHLVVHSTNRPYECVFCNASFRKKGHLTNHIKMHATVHFYECTLCHEKFDERSLLYSHLRTHDSNDRYACDHCQYATTDRSSIYMHMHTHGNPEFYRCDTCNFTALHINLMKEHLKIHDSASTSYHVEKSIAKSGPVILMKCSVCGFTTDSKEDLKTHMMQHVSVPPDTSAKVATLEGSTNESQPTTSTSVQKSTYKCSECSFTCTDAYPFITHMLSHKPKHPLPNVRDTTNPTLTDERCRNSYKTPSVSIEGKEENPSFTHDLLVGMYHCTICGYTCEHQRTIKAHIWKHSGHQDIDYPMFQNGPLSVYDDTPIGRPVLVGAGKEVQKVASIKVVPSSDEGESEGQHCHPVSSISEMSSASQTHMVPLPDNVRHISLPYSASEDNTAESSPSAIDTNVPTLLPVIPTVSNTYTVAKMIADKRCAGELAQNVSEQSQPGSPVEEEDELIGQPQVLQIVQNTAVHYEPQAHEGQQGYHVPEHTKEVYMQIIKLHEESQQKNIPAAEEHQMVMSDSIGEETLETRIIVDQSMQLSGKEQQHELDTVEIVVETADGDDFHLLNTQNVYAVPVEEEEEELLVVEEAVESSSESGKRKRKGCGVEEESLVKKCHLEESTRNRSSRGASVVVEELPQEYGTAELTLRESRGNSPRRASPRSDAAPVTLSDSSRSSSTESLHDNMEEKVEKSAKKKGTKGKKRGGQKSGKAVRERVSSSTAEEMITLLSLLKKGPNYNPACPPTLKYEQNKLVAVAAAAETDNSVDGSDDLKPKTGICSSLLAVIEQLRERSKSESEGDDRSEGKSSGRSAGSRKRPRKVSIDDEDDEETLEGHPNVERVGIQQYRCRLCHYSSPSPQLMMTHMKLHKEKQPFECSLCDYLADCSEDLQDHMLQHCKVRTYQCKACPSVFNYKSQLRAHMRAHEKGPFICTLCRYETPNPISYRNHVRSHSERCSVCSFETTDNQVLRDHMESHMAAKQIDTEELVEQPEQQENMEYTDDGNMIIEDASKNKGFVYVCKHCERRFKSETQLNRHVSIHSQATVYKCSDCEFNTKNFDKMKTHAQTHVEETPMKCELCDFTALSSRSLKSHMKRHANDQRFVQQPLEQYKCNLCGYVCHHLPSLKSHMWRHATDTSYSYNFTNDVINAAIDYDTQLGPPVPPHASNTEISISVRPACLVAFRCCQCGFESIDKAVLNSHMKAHMDIIKKTLEVNKLDSPAVTQEKGQEAEEEQKLVMVEAEQT